MLENALNKHCKTSFFHWKLCFSAFKGVKKLRAILLQTAIIVTGLFVLENFIKGWLVKNQLMCPWCYWAHYQLTNSITATTIKKTPTPKLPPNSLKILYVIFKSIVVLVQRGFMYAIKEYVLNTRAKENPFPITSLLI